MRLSSDKSPKPLKTAEGKTVTDRLTATVFILNNQKGGEYS